MHWAHVSRDKGGCHEKPRKRTSGIVGSILGVHGLWTSLASVIASCQKAPDQIIFKAKYVP
eukprot:1326748-Karenia_brevis.AAC.1